VSLGNWCVMLGNVYVAHDSRLGEYVTCANSVSIAGGVTVGSRTFVGANATVREYSRIGRDVLVGMGSVVIRDILDESVVVGNPGRVIGRLPCAGLAPEGGEVSQVSTGSTVPPLKVVERRVRAESSDASTRGAERGGA
jgi:acyl-[acyl carrier protein]--UDP-N-acetylglucosamine O-acyltransferase